MKNIFVFVLFTASLFAQLPNGGSEPNIRLIRIANPESPVTYVNEDLNKDGRKEILKGEKIIKMADNEYWIKNTELESSSGDVYTFYNKLKRNNELIVRQVTALHGYILVFTDEEDFLEAYIAGENGSKQSDPVLIKLD